MINEIQALLSAPTRTLGIDRTDQKDRVFDAESTSTTTRGVDIAE